MFNAVIVRSILLHGWDIVGIRMQTFGFHLWKFWVYQIFYGLFVFSSENLLADHDFGDCHTRQGVSLLLTLLNHWPNAEFYQAVGVEWNH